MKDGRCKKEDQEEEVKGKEEGVNPWEQAAEHEQT